MKNSKKFSIILVLFCTFCINVQGQGRILNIDVGMSVAIPDKRIFDSSNTFTSTLLLNDSPSFFDELLLRFATECNLGIKTQLIAGLGVSIVFNDVSRLVNYPYFFPDQEVWQLRGWVNGWYFNTSLQPSLGIKRGILMHRDWEIYAGIDNAFSLSLYKSMYESGTLIKHRFSRRTFEPFANELFITTGIQKGRRGYHVDFRAVHMKFLDKALEHNGKRLDFYNPFKIRLRVAFNLNGK